MSTSEPSEPTIIDYARFHRLITDHRSLNPLALLPKSGTWPTSPPLSQTEDHEPDVEALRQSFEHEKLTVDKETARLLSSCTTTAPNNGPWEWDKEYGENLDIRRRAYKLKLEIPLLRTDHELDMQRFGRRIEVDLTDFKVPYESIEEENDEGYTWPAKYYDLRGDLDVKVQREKLEASREVFVFLQSVVRDGYTEEDERVVLEAELRYRRSGIVEPVTPPLFPASPEILPFVPSSPTCNLELLSDHTSPTAMQAAEIEKQLMSKDAIVPERRGSSADSQSSHTLLFDETNIGQIYSPLKDIEKPPSSPLPQRVRPDDRKVEGPLTPPMSVQNPFLRGKNVSFKEMLQEIIPASSLPPRIEEPSETSLQDLDAFFEETIAPIADRFNREVEQEQLQEADSTKRVSVPVMDFSLPVPPWDVHRRKAGAGLSSNKSELDTQKRLMSDVKKTHLKNLRWPAAASEEFKLRWTPFPKELGQIATQESIDDDGSLKDLLEDLSIADIVDSGALTWKREGIRVLDDDSDSDEEELQPGVFKDGKDMDSLIKKRKSELEETAEEFGAVFTVSPDFHCAQRSKVMPAEAPPPSTAVQSQKLPGSTFSAFSALSNFMDVRGHTMKKPKLVDSPFFPATFSNNPTKPNPALAETRSKTKDIHLLTEENRRPIPVPKLSAHDPPRCFIASSAIPAQRRIIRRLQHIYPTAAFIERDFNSYIIPHGKPCHAISDPPSEEADIIISSSTGVIWTTLQHIKQRPLPGQGPHSQIRKRIDLVSARYERLVILVSEDNDAAASSSFSTTKSSGLEAQDCDALASLTASCGTLGAEIPILYTAGGEAELTNWIAGVMDKYGARGVNLLQDETSWELFLRRAGLNAFAAQEILAALKPRSDDGDDGVVGGDSPMMEGRESVEFGLTAFVSMGAEERTRRFEGLLGGTRVLRRVSERLDAVWQ